MGSDLNAIKDPQNNEVLIHNRLHKSGPFRSLYPTVTSILYQFRNKWLRGLAHYWLADPIMFLFGGQIIFITPTRKITIKQFNLFEPMAKWMWQLPYTLANKLACILVELSFWDEIWSKYLTPFFASNLKILREVSFILF